MLRGVTEQTDNFGPFQEMEDCSIPCPQVEIPPHRNQRFRPSMKERDSQLLGFVSEPRLANQIPPHRIGFQYRCFLRESVIIRSKFIRGTAHPPRPFEERYLSQMFHWFSGLDSPSRLPFCGMRLGLSKRALHLPGPF